MPATPPTVRSSAIASPLNIFLLSLLGVVVLVYSLVSFFTQDPIWFWPIFNQQPAQIVIHCYGEEITLEAASAHFLPLTYIINQQLSAEMRVDDISLSASAYNALRQSQVVVSIELYFPKPIRIHSYRSYFSKIDTLLLVLSSDENRWARLYGTRSGQLTPGSIRVANSQAIADYLFEHTLCVGPCKDW